MTDLADHAKSYDGPEIVLTSDLPQRPDGWIVETELVAHDELTPEGQFPEYGQFLRVKLEDGEEEYWEVTGNLAASVMEMAEEREIELVGAVLRISTVSKTPSGEWRFVLDLFSEDADGP